MIEAPKANSPSSPADLLEATLDIWNQAREQHLIPIIGRSMLPLIQTGDQVLVEHGCDKVRRGDVVVFLQSEKIVAHRLLRFCKNGSVTTFITKGDNVTHFDPPINAHRIVGRVLRIKRGSRWLNLDTPAWRIRGWFIAVGMLVWATAYGWGRSLKHRWWGERPNFLTRAVGRSAQGLASFFLKFLLSQLP